MPIDRTPLPHSGKAVFITRGDVYVNPYELDEYDLYGLFRYLSHIVGRAASSADAREQLASIDVEKLHPATVVMLKCLLDDARVARSALPAAALNVIDKALPLAEPLVVDERPMHIADYERMGIIL